MRFTNTFNGDYDCFKTLNVSEELKIQQAWAVYQWAVTVEDERHELELEKIFDKYQEATR
jgi:hypothetical protein